MFGRKKTTTLTAGNGQLLKPRNASAKRSHAIAPQRRNPNQSTLTPHQEKELRRKQRMEAKQEAQKKAQEQLVLKQATDERRRQQLTKKRRMTLVTFTMGLFIMMSALICLFPNVYMITFSTVLMFSFFFLGIAFQRMVMQLLVVAMACVVITGAFFTIIS